MKPGSAIWFPALLAVSALAHAVIVQSRLLPTRPAEVDFAPAETSEIFLVEEPPPVPEPTPEPTPEPLPPEPEPTPIPQEILTAEESPEILEAPPEPTPTPTPKPTPKKLPPPPKPRPAAIPNIPKPVVLKNTPPHYPELARSKGWEGRAIIRVEVSADGRPLSASIAQSSGYGVLDQSALRAVKSWRFQPRTISGIATSGTVEVPVNFSLNR